MQVGGLKCGSCLLLLNVKMDFGDSGESLVVTNLSMMAARAFSPGCSHLSPVRFAKCCKTYFYRIVHLFRDAFQDMFNMKSRKAGQCTRKY